VPFSELEHDPSVPNAPSPLKPDRQPQNQDEPMIPYEFPKMKKEDLEDMDLEELDLQGIASTCE